MDWEPYRSKSLFGHKSKSFSSLLDLMIVVLLVGLVLVYVCVLNTWIPIASNLRNFNYNKKGIKHDLSDKLNGVDTI